MTTMFYATESYYGESCLYNCYADLIKERKLERVPMQFLMNNTYLYENPSLMICKDICVLTAYTSVYTGIYMLIMGVASSVAYCAVQRSILLAILLVCSVFTMGYLVLHGTL